MMAAPLSELQAAWEDLRLRVLGDGKSKPANVPPELVTYITREYGEFRQWIDTAGNLKLFIADVFGGGEWVDRYREAAFAARRAGIEVPWRTKLVEPPESMTEFLQQQHEKAPTQPVTTTPAGQFGPDGEPLQKPGELPVMPRAVKDGAAAMLSISTGDVVKAFVVGLIAALAIRGLIGK